MPNKLTDKEIVKALECCASGEVEECKNCPYVEGYPYCDGPMERDVLELINRYEEKNSNLTSDLTSLQNNLTSLQAENEVLRNCVEQIPLIRKDGKSPLSLLTAEIKAEAYKEFAEEIFELFPADKPNTVISRVTVKHLLKELVGDNER